MNNLFESLNYLRVIYSVNKLPVNEPNTNSHKLHKIEAIYQMHLYSSGEPSGATVPTLLASRGTMTNATSRLVEFYDE